MILNEYYTFLSEEKKYSRNTLEAYKRDLEIFETYLAKNGDKNIENTTNSDIVGYLLELRNEEKSAATLNRKLSSLRSYFKFLIRKNIINVNPTDNIKTPKMDRKQIDFLTVEEINTLLATPDDSVKGIRDRAILELMYATGVRVSELIGLKVSDVNYKMGFIMCNGDHGKARIVPLGAPARSAVETYYNRSRNALRTVDESVDIGEFFFLNYMGEPLTRQGLWKILSEYGSKAGFQHKITPQLIRNSFAAHMVQNGADLKSLQELLGHEDIAATEIYLTLTHNRIKEVYDKTHPRA